MKLFVITLILTLLVLECSAKNPATAWRVLTAPFRWLITGEVANPFNELVSKSSTTRSSSNHSIPLQVNSSVESHRVSEVSADKRMDIDIITTDGTDLFSGMIQSNGSIAGDTMATGALLDTDLNNTEAADIFSTVALPIGSTAGDIVVNGASSDKTNTLVSFETTIEILPAVSSESLHENVASDYVTSSPENAQISPIKTERSTLTTVKQVENSQYYFGNKSEAQALKWEDQMLTLDDTLTIVQQTKRNLTDNNQLMTVTLATNEDVTKDFVTVQTENIEDSVDEDRDYYHNYFQFLQKSDVDNCLSLFICESSANPEEFGEPAKYLAEFLRNYTPLPYNRPAWSFKNAAAIGQLTKSVDFCKSNFPQCNADIKDLEKLLEV